MIFKCLHNICYSRSLLTNSDIDTIESLGVITVGIIEGSFLIDDGIDGDGSFTSLSISDNELSLSSSNGDETVDTLESSLHGFVDRLPGNDTWSF